MYGTSLVKVSGASFLRAGMPPWHVVRAVAAAVFVLLLAALPACTTSTSGGVVGADRRQRMLVSSAQLAQLVGERYARLRAESAQNGNLNVNAAMVQRVRSIAAQLQPQTAVFRRDAPAWKWEVNVIQSQELNAFCMPGGKGIVYSAMVDPLRVNNDEIASPTDEALVATRFSRVDEAEADRIGPELAARAGCDPRAGVTVWRKMLLARQGGRSPESLSTHLTQTSRIRDIESLLPKVVPLYEAARRR